MTVAKFEMIKKEFNIRDDELYFYSKEEDGTLKIRQVDEYELMAEEGLKEVYNNEPEGLWEKCLEG
jgi:hypothetical protein